MEPRIPLRQSYSSSELARTPTIETPRKLVQPFEQPSQRRAAQRAKRGASASGFTLIEVIVAMLIFVIAVMLVGRVLVHAFQNASETSMQTKSEARADTITNDFTADLRAARAPERSVVDMPDPATLQDAILKDQPQTNPDTGAQLDFTDVTYASGTDLVLEADILPGSHGSQPTECVQYTVTAPFPRPGWTLQRNIYAYTFHCGGRAMPTGRKLSSETLIDKVTASHAYGNATPPPGIFSYDLEASSPANPIPANCRTTKLRYPAYNGTSLSARQRNYIVNVGIDLRAVANRSDAAAAQSYVDSVALRSRLGYDYQQALGCS